ncbi:unannotated protein [freshwater metagenome]|uniref:Unannotated protein n=1 Tax=freshwater metagenome TaxID=449393 RepID=A0A6J7A728_9ZZZZ
MHKIRHCHQHASGKRQFCIEPVEELGKAWNGKHHDNQADNHRDCQQNHGVNKRLANRTSQFNVAADVFMQLIEGIVHAAGEFGRTQQRHEVWGEDIGMHA